MIVHSSKDRLHCQEYIQTNSQQEVAHMIWNEKAMIRRAIVDMRTTTSTINQPCIQFGIRTLATVSQISKPIQHHVQAVDVSEKYPHSAQSASSMSSNRQSNASRDR